VTKIDVDQLRKEIRTMNRWNILYIVLKEELSVLGFWRNRVRGDPKKGFAKGWGKMKNGGKS
jgi:hypothetical protein